jgi:hypothetical protein
MPALGKFGSAFIPATQGLASAADAVVVVENGHDRDATASTWLLQLKSRKKLVTAWSPRGLWGKKTAASDEVKPA